MVETIGYVLVATIGIYVAYRIYKKNTSFKKSGSGGGRYEPRKAQK